jgi:hypothetical protein
MRKWERILMWFAIGYTWIWNYNGHMYVLGCLDKIDAQLYHLRKATGVQGGHVVESQPVQPLGLPR